MKKKDIDNLKETVAELEARARQMRKELHEASCKDALQYVALAEKKLSRANPITIAAGQRNEALDIALLMGKVKDRLEHELGIDPYIVSEDE